jgi:hypothetical protein
VQNRLHCVLQEFLCTPVVSEPISVVLFILNSICSVSSLYEIASSYIRKKDKSHKGSKMCPDYDFRELYCRLMSLNGLE